MRESTTRWLPVVGYEDAYEVSDHGGVRSIDRSVVCQDGSVKHLKGVVIRPQAQLSGHLGVTLHKHSKKDRQRVHRLVLAAFIGPCPEGLEVRHLDGNPKNNTLGNLTYGTRSQNRDDAYRHGGRPVGEASHLAKVPDRKVEQLRAMKGHVSSRQAAELVGLSDGHVRRIWRGESRRYA